MTEKTARRTRTAATTLSIRIRHKNSPLLTGKAARSTVFRRDLPRATNAPDSTRLVRGLLYRSRPRRSKPFSSPSCGTQTGAPSCSPSFRYYLAHFQTKLCPRFHCTRPTTQLPNLRSRRIPSGPASQYDHRSQWNREEQHSLCYRSWSQLAPQCTRSQHTRFHTPPHLLLTQILGRASELNSFVKIGATDGYIEIELKGKIGKKNLVVRRSLSSSSKGSTYSLNGQSATGREVTQKMNELNVQVGNLWYVSTNGTSVRAADLAHSLLVLSCPRTRYRSLPTCRHNSSCVRHSVPLATHA